MSWGPVPALRGPRRRARSGTAPLGGQHWREPGLAAGLHQPGHAQRGRGADDLAKPVPDVGIGTSPVGSPCWPPPPGRTVRVLRHQPQPDQAAPVLPHDGQPAQVKVVEREPPSTPRAAEAVVPDLGRLSERPNPTRSAAMARRPASASTAMTLRYRNDQLGSRAAAGRARRRPGLLHVGHPDPVHVAEPGRITEVRQTGETVLGVAAPSCRHAVMRPAFPGP